MKRKYLVEVEVDTAGSYTHIENADARSSIRYRLEFPSGRKGAYTMNTGEINVVPEPFEKDTITLGFTVIAESGEMIDAFALIDALKDALPREWWGDAGADWYLTGIGEVE